METMIKKVLEQFKEFSKVAMQQSGAANSARNWVKGERKETESETWLEAYRTLKREFETLPPAAPEAKSEPMNTCSHCGYRCACA